MAEKKELTLPSETEKKCESSGDTFVYSMIKEEDRPHCEYITEMYNACIDADNLLFPDSNYKRCFTIDNAMYFCNKVEKLSSEESKLVIKIIININNYFFI